MTFKSYKTKNDIVKILGENDLKTCYTTYDRFANVLANVPRKRLR